MLRAIDQCDGLGASRRRAKFLLQNLTEAPVPRLQGGVQNRRKLGRATQQIVSICENVKRSSAPETFQGRTKSLPDAPCRRPGLESQSDDWINRTLEPVEHIRIDVAMSGAQTRSIKIEYSASGAYASRLLHFCVFYPVAS